MAHITWLSLAQLEEEWARDFGAQNLFFTPLATIRMTAAELTASIGREPDTENMGGLGDFHSWGGRIGKRVFQLLAPKTDTAHAGLSVCALNREENVSWSILGDFTDLPDPMLSRIVRVHNMVLDRAPQIGHYVLYFRGPDNSQLPMYFAKTAEEATEVKNFLRWHGVPMELIVAHIKTPPSTEPASEPGPEK